MRRFWLYFALANVIGVFFLWLAARELPYDDVRAYIAAVDASAMAGWCLAFIVVYGVCHAARIFRWYELVRPLGDVEPMVVHRVAVVGFTAILLLPLRLGELVRPYLLARKTDLGMSGVLGTAVVERVIDGLIVTGLLFITLATYRGETATAFARTTGYVSAAIFVPALLVCLLALWRRDFTVGMVRRIGSILSEALAEKAADLLDAFIEGFRCLREADALGRFLVLTLVYWVMNVAALWLLARYAFELDVDLWESTTVLAIFVIGIMIPAGPAMTGNFEFFLIKGLALFVAMDTGPVAARAGAFAATLHVLQFFVVAIPGFIVMWLDPEARHLIRLSEKAEDAV